MGFKRRIPFHPICTALNPITPNSNERVHECSSFSIEKTLGLSDRLYKIPKA